MTERWAQLLKFSLAAKARLVVRHFPSGIIAYRPGAHCGPPILYIRRLPDSHIRRHLRGEKLSQTRLLMVTYYGPLRAVSWHV